MISFVIDDKEMEVEEGTTILEAALDAGIRIPTLCYHKELTPYGACRLCLVEIVGDGWSSFEPSCQYQVTEGLEVKTDTEKVRKKREIILELLLAKAPDSEKLKEMANNYGVTETRFNLNSEGKCILCGLCVRVCAEVVGMNAISFANRGVERRVKTPFDKISDFCIGCGACAYVCPMDAIKIEEALVA